MFMKLSPAFYPLFDLNRVLRDNWKMTQENASKWERLKSEIEKTDKKIDEEVYKLYGLAEAEIKIVENQKN